MIYSRLLHTEHESQHNEDGEGAYTVFSTQQLMDANFSPLKVVCIQTFAVLWNDAIDTRVIARIEESIVISILHPVKLLHASEGTLTIVYDSALEGEDYVTFVGSWTAIAAGVLYDSWSVELIKDTEVGRGWDGGRIFRSFAPGVMATHQLGIAEFTPDMFLFRDDWTPEAVFDPNFREEAEARRTQMQDDPDIFDDEPPF